MNLKRKFLLSLIAGLSINAFAGSANTNVGVSGTLSSGCTIPSTVTVNFPGYASASAITGSGSFSVLCTIGTAWTMAMNAGTTSGGTIAQRLMANGANKLQYNVYKDSGYATLFGNGTTGSTITGTGNGGTQTTTFYGKVPVGQYVNPGAYSDTVTLTLSY